MAKKKKPATPLLLFWSKQDQAGFIAGLERFQGLINDLERLLAEPKRRAEAAAATRAARAAAEAAEAQAAGQPLTPIEETIAQHQENDHAP